MSIYYSKSIVWTEYGCSIATLDSSEPVQWHSQPGGFSPATNHFSFVKKCCCHWFFLLSLSHHHFSVDYCFPFSRLGFDEGPVWVNTCYGEGWYSRKCNDSSLALWLNRSSCGWREARWWFVSHNLAFHVKLLMFSFGKSSCFHGWKFWINSIFYHGKRCPQGEKCPSLRNPEFCLVFPSPKSTIMLWSFSSVINVTYWKGDCCLENRGIV